LNPLALAISQEASFVGRGYAGEGGHLKNLIKEALLYRGFSFLDILQPCVSFDHKHSYSWYEEKVYPVEPPYDPYDKYTAFKKAEEWGEKIPLGVLYKKEKPTFEELQVVLKKGPLISQTLNRSALERAMKAFV
jgi:2-oxoglutarate ferredoxin oxidoreductase subunit beta